MLIANVYVQNVTLQNLTIIRGDTLFRPNNLAVYSHNITNTQQQQTSHGRGYALFVSLNFMPSSDAIGMRLLGLKNLTGM